MGSALNCEGGAGEAGGALSVGWVEMPLGRKLGHCQLRLAGPHWRRSFSSR